MKFEKVHIEISNVCNLQCSFCPEVIRNKKLIDLDLFEKIVQQVAPLTEQIAFHLMGDPLVHPKLAELVEIVHRHESKIFFVTNGVLMREKQAELLLHPAFRQVNFSLHSFFDNFPERDPFEYLDRIFTYASRALEERPDLYINFRLWNLAEVRGSTEANANMLQRIADRFNVAVPSRVDVTKQKSFRLRGRLYLHFDTEFVWPDLNLPILGTAGRCLGLKSHFGVLADGNVVPCCLDKEGTIALGNMKEIPLTQILNSPRALNMLKGFRERRLVENLCQRCNYIDRFKKPVPTEIRGEIL